MPIETAKVRVGKGSGVEFGFRAELSGKTVFGMLVPEGIDIDESKIVVFINGWLSLLFSSITYGVSPIPSLFASIPA